MAIQASFTIDQDDFPLDTIFEQMPDATVELDRVVPTTDAVVPYFWIHSENVEGFVTDMSFTEEVHQLTIIDEIEDELFVRINWNLDHKTVLTAIVDTDVTLLSGVGNIDQWTFEIRAGEQQGISDFHTYCRTHDIPVKLVELHSLSPLQSDQEYDLTESQVEALLLAYSQGYFDSPRTITQDELAERLNITSQAVSSRLQRGLRRLIASTIVTHQNIES